MLPYHLLLYLCTWYLQFLLFNLKEWIQYKSVVMQEIWTMLMIFFSFDSSICYFARNEESGTETVVDLQMNER